MSEKPDLTFTVMAMIVIMATIFGTYKYFQKVITPPSDDTSTLEERIAPLGMVNIEQEIKKKVLAKKTTTLINTKEPSIAVSKGKDIYTKSCASCHSMGIMNAPKTRNELDWKPRLSNGIEALLESAIKGKGKMPAKGGCSNCSDDDLKSAIEYMIKN